MGFWDFLHGNTPNKSEAEIYMEQRNKEYARRAAEYKRREAISGLPEGLFDFFKVFLSSDSSTISRKPKINCSVTTNTQKTTQQTNYTTYSKQQTYNNNNKQNGDCGKCGTSKSIYDQEHLDIFTVENAFVKPTTKVITASGKVNRGGFSVGDSVEIKTTLETRVVRIQQMFRKGESIQYANVSSGKIAMVLSNASDLLVRAGDTIKKKR